MAMSNQQKSGREAASSPNKGEIECKICGEIVFARLLDLGKHMDEKHKELAGDKALGCHLYDQPRDTSQRVLGHKPSLDDYDRMLR
jgi:hypothetical protein